MSFRSKIYALDFESVLTGEDKSDYYRVLLDRLAAFAGACELIWAMDTQAYRTRPNDGHKGRGSKNASGRSKGLPHPDRATNLRRVRSNRLEIFFVEGEVVRRSDPPFPPMGRWRTMSARKDCLLL